MQNLLDEVTNHTKQLESLAAAFRSEMAELQVTFQPSKCPL
jgi:hypothetical protein